MSKLPILLTCADYARLMPLAAGQIQPAGIDLTLTLGRAGSWADRAKMLRRALHDPAVSGGEASLCGQLMRVAQGDRSHVAIPVFPLRNFTVRDLYVRRGGSIAVPADLAGARIGMYGWANSGAVWYRHLLEYWGLDITQLRWWIGPVDEPVAKTSTMPLPPGVHAVPPGGSLSQMLIDGELDAILSPPRPKAFDPVRGPIIRLVPEVRSAETGYFKATGIFPPQHVVVLRRAIWEAKPWIAKALTEAFVAANVMFTAAQRSFPYASPWLDQELEATADLMGEDFHPYGFDANRAQIDVFADQAWQGGIIDRQVTAEEYFDEYLTS